MTGAVGAPPAPGARAWSRMVLTRILVWHLGQVILKTAFFGTFASGIPSLVEQDVQMISIAYFFFTVLA